MPNRQSRLPVVTPGPGAVIIKSASLPVFMGYEPIDLMCGACGATISGGMEARGIRKIFDARAQLIICCPACAAHNEIIDYGAPLHPGEQPPR